MALDAHVRDGIEADAEKLYGDLTHRLGASRADSLMLARIVVLLEMLVEQTDNVVRSAPVSEEEMLKVTYTAPSEPSAPWPVAPDGTVAPPTNAPRTTSVPQTDF